MRKSTRAALVGEYLEKDQAGPLAQLDPELKGMLGLARSLETVGSLEVRPDPGRQAEIKLRLLQEREALTHRPPTRERPRLEDLLRPVLPGRRRYAYAGAVAVLILALVVTTSFWYLGRPGPVAPPGSPRLLALTLGAGDALEVRNAEGAWEPAAGDFEVAEGQALRTTAGRAEVRAGEEALFRLDYASEVEIAALGDGSLALELKAGKAYNRVERPLPYSMSVGEVACSTRGTAFDVERRGERGLLVLAVQHDTGIARGGGELVLGQGSQYSEEDAFIPGGPQAAAPINPEGLDLDWLRYNLEMDQRAGLDPGILPELTFEPPPPPVEPGTIDLTARDTNQGVLLNWKVSGASPQGFEVLRSTSARQPVSPADLLKAVKDPAALHYLDDSIERGMTYYYRVAMLVDGERFYSNAVSVRTQPEPQPEPQPVPPTITLTGYQVMDTSTGMGVQLKWYAEGDLQVDRWVVCRTSGTHNPTYPPAAGSDLCFQVAYVSDHQGYLDTQSIYTGYTLRYRVAALYQGEVVLYSNTFSIYISSIIP